MVSYDDAAFLLVAIISYTMPRAPKFIEHLGSFVANVGKTTIIDCVIEDDRDNEADIEWYFEGKRIKDEGRFRYLFEREDVVGLEIRQITVEDEGEYKCVATNKYGKAESKCEILVNVEGKIIDAPKDSTYDENQTAIFKCKYDGNPRPEVKWFLGKKEIKNGSKYNILNKNQVASLEIYDLTLEDKGTYSIVVSNDAGEDEFTFRLIVNPSTNHTSSKDGKNSDGGSSKKETSNPALKRKGPRKKWKKLLSERVNIKQENPETDYDLLREIGRGKFAVVKECRCKRSGKCYAAKIIRYEADFPNIEFALDEYDLMCNGMIHHKSIPRLHEAWIVRKYLIIMMDLCEGRTLLDHFANRTSFSEEDIVNVMKQLCEVLAHLHSKDILHMDIRPSNIRYSAGHIKLVDFNSARRTLRKKVVVTVKHIGHVEFSAPEVLEFQGASGGTDIWSVAIIAYILCCGVSPFFYPNPEDIVAAIQKVNWRFDAKGFWGITSEAKDFIKRCLVRIPEMRATAVEALKHKWLSIEYAQTRVASVIAIQDQIKETSNRLSLEEEEDFIEASLVFRTFEEEGYISQEDSYDDEEDD